MVDELGEARAVPQMRKHVALYLKGVPGAAALRERLMHVDRAADAIACESRRRATRSRVRSGEPRERASARRAERGALEDVRELQASS